MGAVALELPVILVAVWLVCGRLLGERNPTFGKAATVGSVAFVLLMTGEAGPWTALAGARWGAFRSLCQPNPSPRHGGTDRIRDIPRAGALGTKSVCW